MKNFIIRFHIININDEWSPNSLANVTSKNLNQ
jgi:hypothetical protein